MVEALEANLPNAGQFTVCDRCGRISRKGWSFAFKQPVPRVVEEERILLKCSWCAIRHRPMLRRSIIAAIVVGTILTVLNQGDIIFSGNWNGDLYWKVPLTYCVPFFVSTYGALSISRR